MIPFEGHSLTIFVQGPKNSDIKIYVGMYQVFTINSIKFKVTENAWLPDINVGFSSLSTAEFHKKPFIRDNQITLICSNFLTNGVPPSALTPPNIQVRLGENILGPIKEVELIVDAKNAEEHFLQLSYSKELLQDFVFESNVINKLKELGWVNTKFV